MMSSRILLFGLFILIFDVQISWAASYPINNFPLAPQFSNNQGKIGFDDTDPNNIYDVSSMSTAGGLLTISGSFSPNNGTLEWGDDNASLTSYAIETVNNEAVELLSREWQVSTTGMVPQVNITFDLNNISNIVLVNSEVRLLVKKSGVNTFLSGTVVGKSINFSTTLADGDQFKLVLKKQSVVSLSLDSSDLQESNQNTITATLNINTKSNLDVTVTASFTGTAVIKQDYSVSSKVVTFNKRTTTAKTITITVNDDDLIEPIENTTIDINVANALEGNASGSVQIQSEDFTIQSDDKLSIEFVSSTASSEENKGLNNTEIWVSGATTIGGFDIPIKVTNGTASSNDYNNLGALVKIPANTSFSTRRKIAITNFLIINDNLAEPTETLTFNFGDLSSLQVMVGANGSSPPVNEMVYSILNDDIIYINWSKSSYSSNENSAEDTPEIFISGAMTSTPLSIKITATSLNPAVKLPGSANNDFTFGNGINELIINLPVDNYVTPKSFKLNDFKVIKDNLLERDELFDLVLSSTETFTRIAVKKTTYSIRNDDELSVAFATANFSSKENDPTQPIRLTVSGATLGTQHSFQLSITPSTSSPTLIAPGNTNADYSTSMIRYPKRIILDPKDYDIVANQTITISDLVIVNDQLVENDEVLDLKISNPSIALINLGADATYTIQNDDVLSVSWESNNFSKEEDTNTKPGIIVNGGVLENDISLGLSFTDKSANINSDYTVSNTNLTIPSGDYTTEKKVALNSLNITSDQIIEDDEEFEISIEADTRAKPFYRLKAGASAQLPYTILNDDELEISFSKANYASKENVSSIDRPVITVFGADISSETSDFIVSISYNSPVAEETKSTIDPKDYSIQKTGTNITVNIPKSNYATNSVSIPITALTINNDLILEDDEIINFQLLAGNRKGMTIGTIDKATYTIQNDDQLTVTFDKKKYESFEDQKVVPIRIIVTGAILDSKESFELNLSQMGAQNIAKPGEDYTLSETYPKKIVLNKGDYSSGGTSFVVQDMTITKDKILENDEVIPLSFINPTNSQIIVSDKAEYVIKNDERLELNFKDSMLSSKEDGQFSRPIIEVQGAQTLIPYTIQVNIAGGNGIANPNENNPDYTLGTTSSPLTNPITINIPVNNYNTSKELEILDLTIVKDDFVEEDETLTLSFLNPSDPSISFSGNLDITIENDDFLSVSFDKTSYESEENAMQEDIKIKVSGASLIQDESVNVLLVPNVATGVKPALFKDGTVTNPDYSTSSNTPEVSVSIPAGDYTTEKEINLNALIIEKDNYMEYDEVIDLSFSTTSRPEISKGNSSIYTILNDDMLSVTFKSLDNKAKENEAIDTPILVVSGANITDDVTFDLQTIGSGSSPALTPSATVANPDFRISGNQSKFVFTLLKGDYLTDKEVPISAFTIIDDDVIEKDETISFDIDNASHPEMILTNKTAVYTIINDDMLNVKFSKSSYQSEEDMAVDLVSFEISGGILTEDFSFDFEAVPNTASGTIGVGLEGADYITKTANNQISINIPPSNYTIKRVIQLSDFSIQADNLLEGEELIDLTMKNGSDNRLVLGSNSVYTIENDDALTVRFTKPVYEANENDAIDTPIFEVSGAVTNSIYTFDLTFTSDNTIVVPEGGSGDVDYTFNGSSSKQTIEIKSGDYLTPKNIVIDNFNIVKDNFLEGAEEITLETSNVSNPFIDVSKNAIYRILNDDLLFIEFNQKEGESSERTQENLPELIISGADISRVTGEVSVEIAITDGMNSEQKANEQDVTGIPQKVVLDKIDYSTQVNLKINNFGIVSDLIPEENELLELELNNPQIVLIGKQNTTNYRIIDDDPSVERTNIDAVPLILAADGIDEVVVSVTPKNKNGDVIPIIPGEPNIIQLTFLGTATQTKEFGPDLDVNAYTSSFKATVPQQLLVTGRIGNVPMLQSVVIEFVRPGPGTHDFLLTSDSSPSISGTAPLGKGNSVKVEVNDQTFIVQVQPDPDNPNNATGFWIVPDNEITTLKNGFYDVAVTVLDRANNPSVRKVFEKNLVIDLTNPNIFTADRVTTYETSPAITGSANPNTFVSITINGQTIETEADEDGFWFIEKGVLINLKNGETYDMVGVVKTRAGREGVPITIEDAIIITTNAITANKGFSPNGDGINESWNIVDIELYPKNQVIIFNRWGEVVWKTKQYHNKNNAWDGNVNQGQFKSEAVLPAGTYFYKINLGNGEPSRSGFITLMK